MKGTGFMLLIGGFLVAAFATALDADATNWALFVPAALIGSFGVFLIKRQTAGAARSGDVLAANRSELYESLDNIVAELATISSATDLPVEDLRLEIDRRLRDDLRRFADARESMVHLFSLQLYAEIMSDFAAGERYVNRVWSASADGYGEEARRYLQRAAARFHAARERLHNTTSTSQHPP
ncbi:MAG: hypothetical protein WDZ50_02175 [Woeseia sp.]